MLRQWLKSRTSDFANLEETFFYSRPSAVGIAYQSAPNFYILEPATLEVSFQKAVAALGSNIVMTMSSETTAAVFKLLHEEDLQTQIRATRNCLPIIESLEDLAIPGTSDQTGDFACLVKQDHVVLISTDDVSQLVSYAAEVEQKLWNMVSWPGNSFCHVLIQI